MTEILIKWLENPNTLERMKTSYLGNKANLDQFRTYGTAYDLL